MRRSKDRDRLSKILHISYYTAYGVELDVASLIFFEEKRLRASGTRIDLRTDPILI